MHRTEPTKLQTLALQLSEKITTLMDLTERMITVKGGEMGAFLGRNQRRLHYKFFFQEKHARFGFY